MPGNWQTKCVGTQTRLEKGVFHSNDIKPILQGRVELVTTSLLALLTSQTVDLRRASFYLKKLEAIAILHLPHHNPNKRSPQAMRASVDAKTVLSGLDSSPLGAPSPLCTMNPLHWTKTMHAV